MIFFGDILVLTEPIGAPDSRHGKREAERRAVAVMVASLFGAEARYCHTPDGAPYIEGRPEHISVSHGAGLAAIAVSPRPVGIDVECRRPQLERVAPRFLDADECQRYATPDQLLRAWTAKEAAFKAASVSGLVISAIRLPDLSHALLPDGRRLSVSYWREGDVMLAIAEESD